MAVPSDTLLASRIRALAHPARLAILRRLAASRGCCCGDIVRGLPLAQSTVSQHLRILCDAGIIRGEAEGTRSCYCLDPSALAELAAAIGAVAGPAPVAALAESARR